MESAVEKSFEDLIDVLSDIFGSGGDPDFLKSEIVAVGGTAASSPELAALLDAGFDILAENRLSTIGVSIVRLSLPLGLGAEEALQTARRLAPSVTFDHNHLYRSNGDACAPGACWGQDLIGLSDLPATACRRGAPIAIIDTPVAASLPALADANIVTRSFLPPNVRAASANHGTAVAALLVGRPSPGVAPLAPGAKLLAAEAFRDLDGDAEADAVAIVRGIDWALSQGARVIAMSIEGSPNSILAFGVQAAARRANLVASAGNAGPGGDPAFPAAYPDVMAVAAVDQRLRPYRNGTRGSYVEIAAPGVGITSVGLGGGNRNWTGSSFAVPYVAAALLRARAETQGDPNKARELITRSARDLGAPGRDDIYGHGLVQSPSQRCW